MKKPTQSLLISERQLQLCLEPQESVGSRGWTLEKKDRVEKKQGEDEDDNYETDKESMKKWCIAAEFT